MKHRKRIFCLITAVILALVMTACQKTVAALSRTYSGEIQATNGEMNYTALLDCDGEELTLSFSSPESVAGLSYTFSGEQLRTSLNGLDCITPSDSLPKDSLPSLLNSVFSDTERAQYQLSKDGVDTFSLSVYEGTVTVTAKDGRPLTLTSDSGNWEITFS